MSNDFSLTNENVFNITFSGAGFANILPTFLISCEVQTRYSRILKYFEQYIRDHLSGTKVKIGLVLNMMMFSIFLALPCAS